MVSDPGSKFDFGTFIAYLIPGYILAFLLFCIGDTATIVVSGRSLIDRVSTWGVAEITLATVISVAISYLLGSMLDLFAHPITLQSELQSKERAYKETIEQFKGLLNEQFKALLKDKEVEIFLSSFSTDLAGLAACNFFIDMMFYRLATPEVWARQNWSWSFYEFARQLDLLLIPATTIISYYGTLLIMTSTSSSSDLIHVLIIPAVAATLVTLIVWITPVRRLLQEHRNTGCKVYYRHRAWIVFAYLIETCLFRHSFEGTEEDKFKGLVGITDIIRPGYYGIVPTIRNH